MKIRWNHILPYLLYKITGRHRTRVDNLEWSDNSWTYNLFRFWELVMWRAVGESNDPGDTIRKESSVGSYFDKKKKRHVVVRQFYTRESLIVHLEGMIRNALGIRYWKELWKQKNYLGMMSHPLVVNMAFAGFVLTFDSSRHGNLLPTMMGAVAFDAATSSSSTSWNHTSTGSNGLLWVSECGNDNANLSATYNSVSMTKMSGPINIGNFQISGSLFFLAAQATGTNSVAITGSSPIVGASSSYSGANATGIPDASTTGTVRSSSTATKTLTIATILDNCWTVLGASANLAGGGNPTLAAGTGSTNRSTLFDTGQNSAGIFDSNGVVTPAGNKSMTVTWVTNSNADSGCAVIMASFPPVQASASTATHFLSMMGMGK